MKDVILTWKGEEHCIEAREVIPVIAKIENVLTFNELAQFLESGNIPVGKVSQAYAIALRCAGVRVNDNEVYEEVFGEIVKLGINQKRKVVALEALEKLMVLMIPPEHLQEKEDGKKNAGIQASASNLSKKRTKRQSLVNSGPKNSGG